MDPADIVFGSVADIDENDHYVPPIIVQNVKLSNESPLMKVMNKISAASIIGTDEGACTDNLFDRKNYLDQFFLLSEWMMAMNRLTKLFVL